MIEVTFVWPKKSVQAHPFWLYCNSRKSETRLQISICAFNDIIGYEFNHSINNTDDQKIYVVLFQTPEFPSVYNKEYLKRFSIDFVRLVSYFPYIEISSNDQMASTKQF